MGLAFGLLLPLGAFLLRLPYKNLAYWHAGMQSFTCFIAVIGSALGLSRTMSHSKLAFYHAHPIFGSTIIALLLLQPLLGLMHHHMYLATGIRTYVVDLHRWYGRVLLILGVINGGLGLRLSSILPERGAGDHGFFTSVWLVIYAFIVTAMILLYLGVDLVRFVRKSRGQRRNHERVAALEAGSRPPQSGLSREDKHGSNIQGASTIRSEAAHPTGEFDGTSDNITGQENTLRESRSADTKQHSGSVKAFARTRQANHTSEMELTDISSRVRQRTARSSSEPNDSSANAGAVIPSSSV